MTLTTPALLFPAISLLLLAYTSRFVALANVIRALHATYREGKDVRDLAQIKSLRQRLKLIQQMQEAGVLSFFCCTLSMGAILLGWQFVGVALFSFSILLLSVSLLLSILEIHRSVHALDIRLSDLEENERRELGLH